MHYVIVCVNGNTLCWAHGTPIEFMGWNYCWRRDAQNAYLFASLGLAVDVLLANDWPKCNIIPLVI